MTEKNTKYLDYALSKCAEDIEKNAGVFGSIYNAIKGAPSKAQGIYNNIQDPNGVKHVEDAAKATRAVIGNALTLAVGAAIPLMTINSMKNKIQNDTRRKALIEDLYQNDPIIKNADREEVIQYYATIFSIAPSVSLDKNVVRELLQNFIKFGRVDIQTIKTLAETERSISQSKSLPFRVTDALHLMG